VQVKQKLRLLAGIAYERELATASELLLSEFQRWQNKEIDVIELHGKIHEFHNGISRKLYNHYAVNNTLQSIAIAGALNRGVLSREDVGEELFNSLEGIANTLTSQD
jgi:hypothetical protein